MMRKLLNLSPMAVVAIAVLILAPACGGGSPTAPPIVEDPPPPTPIQNSSITNIEVSDDFGPGKTRPVGLNTWVEADFACGEKDVGVGGECRAWAHLLDEVGTANFKQGGSTHRISSGTKIRVRVQVHASEVLTTHGVRFRLQNVVGSEDIRSKRVEGNQYCLIWEK